MPLIDHLFSVGAIRKAIWKLWYPFLTRRLRREDVLFLNYAFETEPPLGLPLSPADEPNRACIQLYHHVATQVELRGNKILEVSCGHGGGASYLTRTLQPATTPESISTAPGSLFAGSAISSTDSIFSREMRRT